MIQQQQPAVVLQQQPAVVIQQQSVVTTTTLFSPIIRLAILLSLLSLSAILLLVGMAGSWVVLSYSLVGGTNPVYYTLSSYVIGSVITPIPSSSPAQAVGAAAQAFLALAFLVTLASIILVAVLLHAAIVSQNNQNALGVCCVRVNAPVATFKTYADPSKALVGTTWAAFVLSLIGLSCGVSYISVLFGSSLLSLTSIVTFPARDATSTAFVFLLFSVILATLHTGCCCCCGRNNDNNNIIVQGNPLSVRVLTVPPTPQSNPMHQETWKRVTDGKATWFQCQNTGATAWAPPEGAIIIG
jgi:hypothetical protein